MKILIANDSPTAHKFIREGFAAAFASLGFDVLFWDIHQQSVYEAFDSFEPDIFWGQTYNLDKHYIKCIQERPHLKLIMRAFDYGPFADEVKKKYPIGVAEEEHLKLAEQIREYPLVLHNHYPSKYIPQTHEGWLKEGYNVISLMNAADVFRYSHGQYDPALASDIAFVGGRWGYKSQTIDPFLLQYALYGEKRSLKIFGNSNWGIPQYCGPCSVEMERDLLFSSKICPNISEPHSQAYGYDIVERPFKVAATGSFCVSDYVEGLAELIPTMAFAKTPKDFRDLVEYYLDNDEEREEQAVSSQKEVITNHTYLDRVNTVMTEFGYDFTEQVLDIKKKIGVV